MRGKALGEYVLVKPNENKEIRTASGLVLPSDSKGSNTGMVMSIGNKVVDPGFGESDIIVFSSYSRDVVTIDDEEFIIMPVKDIKMVLK